MCSSQKTAEQVVIFTLEIIEMTMQNHQPMEEEKLLMHHHLIWQPEDVGGQKDLSTLLRHLKKTAAFYSHEPSSSVQTPTEKEKSQNSTYITMTNKKSQMALSSKQRIATVKHLSPHGEDFFELFCCAHQTILQVIYNCS